MKRIIFSDKATFLNGKFNWQNCRYWAAENSQWTMKYHTLLSQKVNVWCAIIGQRFLGSYFFKENLTGARYLDFLQYELIPAWIAFYTNEKPDLPSNNLFFPQDGVPSTYAADVRCYLDEIFPSRWIGRRRPIEWPARSTDLILLCYFFLEILKKWSIRY